MSAREEQRTIPALIMPGLKLSHLELPTKNSLNDGHSSKTFTINLFKHTKYPNKLINSDYYYNGLWFIIPPSISKARPAPQTPQYFHEFGRRTTRTAH